MWRPRAVGEEGKVLRGKEDRWRGREWWKKKKKKGWREQLDKQVVVSSRVERTL